LNDGEGPARAGHPFRLFVPILAGATLRDRLIACLGAAAGLALTAFLCGLADRFGIALPLLVAPVGASAVLLFAVPSSPLAQPWPIFGGNLVSALIGLAVAQILHTPLLAAGVAVGLAIAAMSLTRSLHPPGGAVALSAVLASIGTVPSNPFVLLLAVALNSAVLVAFGWGFHRISGHVYPHKHAPVQANTHGTRDLPPQSRVGFSAADVDAALHDLGETYDIDRDDLDRLLRQIEMRAMARMHDDPSCADIMSRDVIAVGVDSAPATARVLLLEHGIRGLPVLDAAGRLAGSVGLRELMTDAGRVGDVMATPFTAGAGEPAFRLAARLSEGTAHAVMIVDVDRRVLGLVTQTDLLSALCRTAATSRV